MTTTIGLDLGGTKALAVRFAGGRVVAESRLPKPPLGLLSPDVFETAGDVWTDDVRAIGAGVAGLVDRDGAFVWGPHVAGTAIPVRHRLEEAFSVTAIVDNDATMAAFAELRAGAAVGHRDVLLITIGTGIGGAIVAGGEIRRGTHGFAGEWGHVVVDPAGIDCACGNRGCWETLVSGPALRRANGDARTVGRALGRGLIALTSVFDPALIVIGGGLSDLGDALVEPARSALADGLHGRPHRRPPAVVTALLGPSASAVGAALMAAELAA